MPKPSKNKHLPLLPEQLNYKDICHTLESLYDNLIEKHGAAYITYHTGSQLEDYRHIKEQLIQKSQLHYDLEIYARNVRTALKKVRFARTRLFFELRYKNLMSRKETFNKTEQKLQEWRLRHRQICAQTHPYSKSCVICEQFGHECITEIENGVEIKKMRTTTHFNKPFIK
jgi:hypothetical protein